MEDDYILSQLSQVHIGYPLYATKENMNRILPSLSQQWSYEIPPDAQIFLATKYLITFLKDPYEVESIITHWKNSAQFSDCSSIEELTERIDKWIFWRFIKYFKSPFQAEPLQLIIEALYSPDMTIDILSDLCEDKCLKLVKILTNKLFNSWPNEARTITGKILYKYNICLDLAIFQWLYEDFKISDRLLTIINDRLMSKDGDKYIKYIQEKNNILSILFGRSDYYITKANCIRSLQVAVKYNIYHLIVDILDSGHLEMPIAIYYLKPTTLIKVYMEGFEIYSEVEYEFILREFSGYKKCREHWENYWAGKILNLIKNYEKDISLRSLSSLTFHNRIIYKALRDLIESCGTDVCLCISSSEIATQLHEVNIKGSVPDLEGVCKHCIFYYIEKYLPKFEECQ